MSKPQVVIPRFEVLRRGEVLQILPINRNRLVVGSEDGAHLRLKHPAIAPRHLEVMVVNGRYLEAANLAGEGRVLLGGQPMNRARLRDGDELDLGPVTLRLTYYASESAADAAIGGSLDDDEEEETVEAGAPVEQTTGEGSVGSGPPPAMGKNTALLNDESDTSSRLSTLGQLLVRPGSTTSESLPALSSHPDTTESTRLAVDLDDMELDPAPMVIIEPPGGKAQEVPLRVGSFVVGAGRCAFRLSYPGVAPAHTEIMVMPDGVVYVKHLAGSGLLTIRNGAPIQFARWTAGDRLQVGPVAMRLELVARELLSSVTHVAKVTSTHAGGSQSAADSPAPQILSAAMPAGVDPELPFSGSTTFSGRALRQTVTEDGPAPVSEPLVKVHISAKQPGKAAKGRKKKKRSKAPRSHSVEVSLDVSSYDTFQSFEEELDYRPSSARRYFLQALLLLLAIGVFGQYLYIQQRIKGDDQGSGDGPQTASGDSGLQASGTGARTVGEGPVQVGSREGARRSSHRKGAGKSRDPRDRNIDWDDSRGGIFFEGARRSNYSGAKADSLAARPADELERTEAVAAPSDVTGGQGFVEMKLVNSKISAAHRKFRYCYEQARQDDDSLEGTMWLNMTLGVDGRIRGVVVEQRSSLKSDAMRRCMEKKLFSLKMPKPRGGAVTFSAPFKFSPTD